MRSENRSNRLRDRFLDLATIAAATAALIVGGLSLWERFATPVLAARPATIRDWREYAASGNQSGPPDAPVTIVYFGDYECPYCRRVAPVLDTLHAEFPTEVRIVHRHWPLEYHEAAYPAARAAECAGEQGKFAAYNTLLYSDDAWMEDLSLFEELAIKSDVRDIEAFRSCASSSQPVDVIERDIIAVAELGGRGTPTLLINDKLQRRVPTLDELRAMVREAAAGRN